MNRLIVLVLVLFGYISGFGQARPTGLPSPNSTGYSKIGFYRADSAFLMGLRTDTNWIPIVPALTAVKFPGKDTSRLYMYDGIKWKDVTQDLGGNKVDSVQNIGDSLYYYINGTQYFVMNVAAAAAGGDTTTYEVVDSTGQPARRVLISKAGNKIGSSPYFLFDTINNKLVIGSPLISSGGSTYKLFVNGKASFDDILADTASINHLGLSFRYLNFTDSVIKVNGLEFTTDTAAYKPMGWDSVSKKWARFPSWPVPPSLDTTSLSNRINAKADTSITLFAGDGLIGGGNLAANRSFRVDTTAIATKLWATDRLNEKVDSVTSSNDSLYYWKNGTATYVSSFTGFDTAVVVKAQVHNAESTTLLAGEVVYSFGATGNLMSVKRAWNKQDATSSKTFGIVRKNILAGGTGWIVTNGVVDKLNLGAYSEGDQVYLDSIPGKFTATKPYAPYHMVAVGVIERANNGNGQIYVKVQNGYELDELHNVSARFPTNNQVLKFRTSDSLWHNATDTGITSLTAGVGLTGGTISTTGTIAADTNVLSTRAWRQKGLDSLAALELSLSDTAAMLNPYARGTGANGQVAYWNGTRSLTGSNNLFYNATNRRLGIGTASPSGYLNIAHAAADSNTSSIVTSGYNLTGSNAQSAVDISGTWNTTGTPTLIKANVTNTASGTESNLIDLQVAGSSLFRVNRLGQGFFYSSVNTSSTFNSTLGFILNAFNHAFIGGNRILINTTNASFSPTSGTSTFTLANLGTTINQTGGANGITRGLYVNPTLTSAADWRSIEWSNNTGRGIWGVGTAENAMAGPTTIGAAASPNAAAVLDLTSTTRGFLPPRMTAVQRTGISNTAGLLVWDTDSSRYMLNTGSAWRGLSYTSDPVSGAWGTSGNTGLTTNNFIGTTDSRTMRFRTNNTERFYIDSIGNVGVTGGAYQYVGNWGAGQSHIIRNDGNKDITIMTGGTIRFQGGTLNSQYATLNPSSGFSCANIDVSNVLSTATNTSINFGGPSFGIGYGQYRLGTLVLKDVSTSAGISTNTMLELRTTTKGFLPPVQTTAQKEAITGIIPRGLYVYDSTAKTTSVNTEGTTTGWRQVPNGLKNSATLDFGNTTAQTSTDLTITVTGAAEGDMVFLGTPNASVNANTNFTAWVSAANTVTIRFNNYSSGAVDPASGTFRVYVIKN